MGDDSLFKTTEVTDGDIAWVTRLLKLPDEAFYGKDLKDPRQDVLKSMVHIDIAACPGSGKTTLLVAKLAILAEKWQYHTRGICVLSHTNVARNEIEARLGNTTAGRSLLSYPHYIGTIHGFVNEFLAIPWLRALGYPIKMIDTDVCLRRRWNSLPSGTRKGLETNNNKPSILSIKSSDFSVGEIRWGRSSVLGKTTQTYTDIQEACRQSTVEGYFCYHEMFMWARDLMDHVTNITKVIRSRFPLLFIDEAQDNSEEQSSILHKIFMSESGAVIRQRFGDGNQAIFDSVFDSVIERAASTDEFPNGAIKDLPNSHRFGQKIADLADPLGLIPYDLGLKGHGPKRALMSGALEGGHTIFLFDDDSTKKVMDAYAELLIETFSERELREGTFWAIGQRHSPPEEKTDGNKIPYYVGHYWPDYDPQLSSRDPKPKTFVQYVFAGMGRAEKSREVYLAVGKIAEGVLRLAGMAERTRSPLRRQHSHRYIMELLDKNSTVKGRYEEMIATFAVKREVLTKEMWDKQWCGVVRGVAETITEMSLSSQAAKDFLKWKDLPNGSANLPVTVKSLDNIYRYPAAAPKVGIRVGSIHSVKGETHMATLVLETFYRQHNLEQLLPWLCGNNCGGMSESGPQQSRLKLHYVAMTRPAHLLCLAMKKKTFEDANGDLNQKLIGKLNERGWQVKLI